MNEDTHENIVITSAEEGERLDKILTTRYQETHSRTYFQMLIEKQLVLVNGSPAKKRTPAKVGDEIEIRFLLTPEIKLTPENIPLEILYEDSDLIAVNKPAGLVVHPAAGNWSGTFVNALLYHCSTPEINPASPLRPGIVHRLDKETTGVLIAAKTSLAHQRLVEHFASRKIYKEYLAICIGNPREVILNLPIGRDPINRKLMSVVESGGKSALTICKPIASQGDLHLVKVELATGRTHQIRVHLKHHKTPILGDPLYGSSSLNAKYGVQRQLLHAHCIRFEHPITGVVLEIVAPLPADMREWVNKFTIEK